MKAQTPVLILCTAVLAAMGGWFASRRSTAHEPVAAPSARKILYYQSAMHPWIKSDRPGNCTICGMKLTPVYEGEKGFAAGADLISLPTNSITVVNVQTETVERRLLVHTLRVTGRIEDDDTRHRIVSAYIDGRIDKLSVNYVGAEVVEGQPLATFYSPQLLTAEREYVNLFREAHVFATNSAAAAVLGREHANLLQSAAQRLRRLGLTDDQIEQLRLKPDTEIHTELRAPMSGTVITRSAYEGQYVKEGEKLFEIGDFSTMWFVFDAYERDLAWIKPGEKVEVRTPALPGKVFTAPITFVDPTLSDITRSAKVRVEIPNPFVEENGRKSRLLYYRLYAEGLVKAEMPEALVVPRSAVVSPGPQAVAYVDLGGGSYQQRKLKLGRLGDNAWEVIEGLHEGERVVSAGNLLIDAQTQLNQTAEQGALTAHGEQTGQVQAGEADAATHQEVRHALTNVAMPSSEKLSGIQKTTARGFLIVADAIGAALAADKLDLYNEESAKLRSMLPTLTQQFLADRARQPLVEKVSASGTLAKASDLTAARKAFVAFSNATVEFAKRLRHDDPDFAGVKVFQCPMTDRVFPGAPKSAQWLQLKTEIRNPFFGSAMIDCGTEVK